MSQPAKRPQSLFDRLGGDTIYAAASDQLSQQLLESGEFNAPFAGMTSNQQKDVIRAFVSIAFGLPSGDAASALRDQIAEESRPTPFDDDHFDTLLDELALALSELAVPDNLIVETQAVLECAREEILG